jgi:hypothetical protein
LPQLGGACTSQARPGSEGHMPGSEAVGEGRSFSTCCFTEALVLLPPKPPHTSAQRSLPATTPHPTAAAHPAAPCPAAWLQPWRPLSCLPAAWLCRWCGQ